MSSKFTGHDFHRSRSYQRFYPSRKPKRGRIIRTRDRLEDKHFQKTVPVYHSRGSRHHHDSKHRNFDRHRRLPSHERHDSSSQHHSRQTTSSLTEMTASKRRTDVKTHSPKGRSGHGKSSGEVRRRDRSQSRCISTASDDDDDDDDVESYVNGEIRNAERKGVPKDDGVLKQKTTSSELAASLVVPTAANDVMELMHLLFPHRGEPELLFSHRLHVPFVVPRSSVRGFQLWSALFQHHQQEGMISNANLSSVQESIKRYDVDCLSLGDLFDDDSSDAYLHLLEHCLRESTMIDAAYAERGVCFYVHRLDANLWSALLVAVFRFCSRRCSCPSRKAVARLRDTLTQLDAEARFRYSVPLMVREEPLMWVRDSQSYPYGPLPEIPWRGAAETDEPPDSDSSSLPEEQLAVAVDSVGELLLDNTSLTNYLSADCQSSPKPPAAMDISTVS